MAKFPANSFFAENGPLGCNGRNEKHNQEAFNRLLDHLEIKNRRSKIRLEGLFDILDQHGVAVEDAEVDEMVELTDKDGEVDKALVAEYSKQASFWKTLGTKKVFADQEILDKMSVTLNSCGRPLGPPRVSKLDTILKQINKVNKAFEALDKDKDGLVSRQDFARNFPTLSPHQIDCCFNKFDEDRDNFLNFVEFKNFMAKRKSLPDKALARCCSTLSLKSLPDLEESTAEGILVYSGFSMEKLANFDSISE